MVLGLGGDGLDPQTELSDENLLFVNENILCYYMVCVVLINS
jgi:hypothetical protein